MRETLQQMADLAGRIRISYKREYLCEEPISWPAVDVVYDAAQDPMIGENLDEGWFEEEPGVMMYHKLNQK